MSASKALLWQKGIQCFIEWREQKEKQGENSPQAVRFQLLKVCCVISSCVFDKFCYFMDYISPFFELKSAR